MKLHRLQEHFSHAALHNAPEVILPSIAKNNIAPADRLSVYHHNIVGNLVDVLADTFSATRKLVGEAFFRSMARQFVPHHMPDNANLNVFGGAFPAFIAAYPPAANLPYLADVTRFEWLWNEAYLSPDDEPLTPQSLAPLTPEDYANISLRLRTSARLFSSNYPVDDLWAWCDGDGKTSAPDLHSDRVHILITRPILDVKCLRLSRSEYVLLDMLSSGATLAEAAETVTGNDASFDLAACLARHFGEGTFQSIERK